MKLQTLALTIAALAVLSALAFFVQRPPKPTGLDARTGQPVFDTKVLEKTARIRLTDQGKAVVLAKSPDGKWVVSSYYDLPVDVAKLGRFLEDLTNARIQRLVTRTPERLVRLEFKATSIALLDAAGQAIWKLTLGKDAEGGGRFVRFDDEQKGYLANLSAFLDSESKNWADSLLASLKSDDLSGIEITFAGGDSVVATRAKKEEAWTAGKAPAGQRIKGDRITSLLSSFASLRFQDTSDLTDANAEAARKNSRTVKFTTFDHRTITVQLGRKPEEKIVKPAEPAKAGDQKETAPGKESKLAETQPAASPGAVSEFKPAQPEPASSPPAKPEEPKVETIPAGPVYVFITDSDAAAPVNVLMKKRAFQILDWSFTSLPQKPDEMFESAPPAPPAVTKPDATPGEPTPETKPAEKPAATPKP